MTNFPVYAMAGGLAGLLIALSIYVYLRRQPTGTAVMLDIATLIEDGAMAFLRREYTVLTPFLLAVAALLAWAIGPWTAGAYLFGGVCSVFAGLIGMKAATKANVRTSEAARSVGQGKALFLAYNGGAVMGLAVASLGLVGIGTVTWLVLDPATADLLGFGRFTEILSGFAMGASSIALFARVGGGIYTKAADVGADLVGKVEAGIPEDDPRNPATIADNVGDNVGDVAGMGADIFESYVGAVIATVALAATSPAIPDMFRMNAIALPILMILAGLAASVVGIAAMRLLEHGDPANAMRNTTLIAAGAVPGGGLVAVRSPGSRHGRQAGARRLLRRPRRHRRRHRHRGGHRVLHLRQAGAGHRAGLEHRRGHQHHRRPLGRDDLHPAADPPDQRGHLRLLLGGRPLRHRHRRRRHAGHRRRHHDGRRLRSDRRQRRRHLRDERARPRGPQDHRRARRPRQHHRRHRQGLRDRVGGADGAGAVHRLRHRRRPRRARSSGSTS